MKRRNFLVHSLGATAFAIGKPGLSEPGFEIASATIIREAHRGYSLKYPENTIPAFQTAITAGVDRIELDLRISADGKPVVIHDDTLDRTTNASGKVKKHTLNELKKLDAGKWKSPDFKGVQIPTLEEVFDLAKGNCFIDIDLKDADAARPMVNLAEKMNMVDQIVITGKIPECAETIRQINNSVTMFYEFSDEIVKNEPENAVKKIREFQLPGCIINFKAANTKFIRECKLHGLSVLVWGVLKKEDMQKMIKLGVDSIMTDDITLLNNVLHKI
ncbi:MAG: glycerophosphodiester phosphodiesterase [Mariniphaga sp.]